MKSKLDLIEIANIAFDAVNESRIGPVYTDPEKKSMSFLASNSIALIIENLLKEKE